PDGLTERIQAEVEGITEVHVERRMPDEALNPDTIITILAKRGRRALPDLLQITADAGLDVISVEVREPDLEAVFLHLTRRALRD
ncbi:MAG TPA: hypothetical protein VKY39_00920, partial [Aggregatilineales bacterium]|nr:hypothetical protein [Aggregatilineales bacterium]